MRIDTKRTSTKKQMNTPAECVCFNLRKAARSATQAYDKALKPSGIKGTQFSLLVALSKTGPISVSELADLTATERTTLTRNLNVLLKRKLVMVQSGDDQRKRIFNISPGGIDKLEKAYPLWRKAQDYFVNGLGESKWRAIHKGLSEITAISKR